MQAAIFLQIDALFQQKYSQLAPSIVLYLSPHIIA